MGEFYTVGAGGSVSGGRWRSGGPVNVWSQLTVAAHSRKVLGGGVPNSPVFDPSNAIAVDAMSPSTVQAIPIKAFSSWCAGEPGIMYYVGGLHSNYKGNEIDRIDLRDLAGTQVTTAINHQPAVPPAGPGSGYNSSGSQYIYRQYGSPPNPADWQPYTHHSYTKCTIHPTWGHVQFNTGALGDGTVTGPDPAGNGSGYPQGTTSQAIVTYDFAEGRYHMRATPVPGTAGNSDWSPHRQSIVVLDTGNGQQLIVKELVGESTTAVTDFSTTMAAIGSPDWTAGQGGNGVLIKHLEGNKYLVLRMDYTSASTMGSGLAYHTVLLIELSPTSAARVLALPAGPIANVIPSGDGNLSFTVDRNSRRIFWLVHDGVPTRAPRFYVATFDAPMDWTEIVTTGLPSTGWLSSLLSEWSREALSYYNGHLFLLGRNGPSDPGYTDGAIALHRLKVDGGELLPAMTFNRFDYHLQDFRYSNSAPMTAMACKHTNWAWHAGTAKYYQCAGDLQHSYSSSMASLAFDGSGRGYTFVETLDELTPAPIGKVPPACPDDGFWFPVPADSAWVAGRGKMVWQRGGEGITIRGSQPMQSAYATDAAAIADRWNSSAKYYVWDPTSPGGFDALMDGGSGWTQDNGGIVFPNVWEKTATSSRMGCFDPSTGCVWRFYDAHVLARIDFQNQSVKIFNLSTWVSPDTGRTIFMNGNNPPSEAAVVSDGQKEKFCWFEEGGINRWHTYGDFHWEHKAVWIDPATGYLYVVSPGTGYLWRYDTRGTHTLTGDGWRLPFGPVGKRIPLVGCYPPLNSRGVWPPAVYNGDVRMNSRLYPFKGGLLWLSSNHHSGGDCGEPYYAFWRRLDHTGEWSVVTMPKEFAANTGAAKDPYSSNNAEILLLAQTPTDIDRQWYPFFWKVT